MKIVINTDKIDLFNTFNLVGRLSEHQMINAKSEQILFEQVENESADAYVLLNDNIYFKRAVDFIKKHNPYVPIIGISTKTITSDVNADIYMYLPVHEMDFEMFVINCIKNIETYTKIFATLKKLTTKISDKIEFANCIYDPTRRLLYYKGKEVKKLSAKEGGILEVLASNYGNVVKKDVILEKVWHGTDYFKGRSMDVYITYLRNTLKNNKIKLTIKNISGIGLILE